MAKFIPNKNESNIEVNNKYFFCFLFRKAIQPTLNELNEITTMPSIKNVCLINSKEGLTIANPLVRNVIANIMSSQLKYDLDWLFSSMNIILQKKPGYM